MDLQHYDWLARVESRLAAALAPRADLLICNSSTGRTFHVEKGYPAERTILIPNGIDLERFRPDRAARLELRRQWGVGSDECLVGLVARLDPMKDHANFLRAAAQVLQCRSNARFVCVGDGPADYRQKLEGITLSLGLAKRLSWVNARSDVERIYNALDVAVLSSAFGEGFPNVIAEAMATGVPCVVTNVGDAAGIVGDTGWVCPPNDSAALAWKIIEALDAIPCDAAAIRARVSTLYGRQALIDRTEARFIALLGAGGAIAVEAPGSSVSVLRRDA
jgi:glycosyltransferase involved in cell wall biosynthesis